MTRIGEVKTNTSQKNNTQVAAQKTETLNSVFDIDKYGNNNGKMELEDFVIAYKNGPNSLKSQIENLYIEYVSLFLDVEKEVGDYKIFEVELPFQLKGVTDKRKVIKDKKTGEVIFRSSTIIKEENGLTTVNYKKEHQAGKYVNKNNVSFQYNKTELENYIINDATDSHGNKIKYYSSIPQIRSLPKSKRTPEQKALLQEFDNMVKYIIEAGVDYGMDPKFITAIIQQEVGFQGLSPRVVGKNGKGYMQLTSAPIKDFLGYVGNNKYNANKEGLYGPEVQELLESRGFHLNKAKTSSQKQVLYEKIFAYLKDNKDPEFNIRFGTLVLRYYTNKHDGSVPAAAKNYNGSPHREKYSKNVTKYTEILSDTVPKDTTYKFEKNRIK